MPAYLSKFVFLFCIFLVMMSSVKFGVDTCLPDRGSRIFSDFFRSPKPICSFVQNVDRRAREGLVRTNGVGDILIEDTPRMRKNTTVDLMRYALQTPTVFVAKLPVEATVMWAALYVILIPALLLATVWQLVSVILNIQPAQLPKGRKRVTATYRLLRDQND